MQTRCASPLPPRLLPPCPLSPGPLPPRRLPPGPLPPHSCDTHCHVFGPVERYPLSPTRGYTPAIASIGDYRAVMQAVGIARAVLVQPSVYGTDNRALLDALDLDAAGTLRGVVVVPPDVDDLLLDLMHDLGVRGVRVNATSPDGLPLSAVAAFDRRLHELGWHLQLQIDVEKFVDLDDWLAPLTVPVVIEHFGFVDVSRGTAGEGFARLRRLVERGTCYVKMSAPYHVSAFDRPPYADMTPLARALMEANPHRVLWATDWPHPNLLRPMPDDADLVQLIADWIPDAANRQRVLVDNPSALYWNDGSALRTV